MKNRSVPKSVRQLFHIQNTHLFSSFLFLFHNSCPAGRLLPVCENIPGKSTFFSVVHAAVVFQIVVIYLIIRQNTVKFNWICRTKIVIYIGPGPNTIRHLAPQKVPKRSYQPLNLGYMGFVRTWNLEFF